MFQTKFEVKNRNTFYFEKSFFFRKSCRLWDNTEKYGTARQATDGDTAKAVGVLDI